MLSITAGLTERIGAACVNASVGIRRVCTCAEVVLDTAAANAATSTASSHVVDPCAHTRPAIIKKSENKIRTKTKVDAPIRITDTESIS
jgi:hypothetical protein